MIGICPDALNLGSGKTFLENYLNVDIEERWQPDIVLNFGVTIPDNSIFHTKRFGKVILQHSSFKEIIAHDVLEHIPDLTTAMHNCLNLLDVDGVMHITVPYDLSYGSWQDPTHIHAFNERSWLYYTDWYWYLGWSQARFERTSLNMKLSPYGIKLQKAGKSQDEILNSPRAVDAMHVVLTKRLLTEEERTKSLLMQERAMTCATTEHLEHETQQATPEEDSLLQVDDADWGDYAQQQEETDLRATLSEEFTRLHQTISERDEVVNHFTRTVEKQEQQIAELERVIAEHEEEMQRAMQQAGHDLAQTVASRDRHIRELSRELNARDRQIAALLGSKSWRITHPLRVVMTQWGKVRRLIPRVWNGFRYLLRGDFKGFWRRLKTIQAERARYSIRHCASPEALCWGIMATPHTMFIAHLIASRLQKHGWSTEIFTDEPDQFDLDYYFVICPQMFQSLPPGERRIAFQLEQSVSSRWFTQDYLKSLENSLCVLDYALINIEFLAQKGITYPHIFYLPIGSNADYIQSDAPTPEKCYDVLFYGDSLSSPRRQKLLQILQKHFQVKFCNDTFGQEMIDEIRRAKVVVNLHYYEHALLETPRLHECLSLGTPVVSESAQDQSDYPELAHGVTFFPEGDEQAMVEAVRTVLNTPERHAELRKSVECGSKRFAFMFDRFLAAMNFVPVEKLANDELEFPCTGSRIALSLPETISRRRIYLENQPQNCRIFDGVRLSPGWIGCAMSYSTLSRYALNQGVKQLTIIEDDVLLPSDFEEKMHIIETYLREREGQWDVFAGVIALLHEDTRVLKVETFQGMTFVTIDKMTSMVCNIYSEKILTLLSHWDSNNRDAQNNTIDKYLERQEDLRVVTTLPFIVGHREEVQSTLWGFQNTQYLDLIAKSEHTLRAKVEAFQAKMSCENS
ncbi:glycosyltransferase family protein [Desulfovibrio inopinatus]|uniref:glycosyltransferase family protein n=1 Tax=Desulfovibrio inopinatus TaxID=102109 RepID=UPI00040B5BC4|nr:glycosyltransferase family 25 protein [Desulfovibrio inopinatus]